MVPGTGTIIKPSLNPQQRRRVEKLRREVDSWAKPLGSLDALRYAFDELLAILLDQPGETSRRDSDGQS